MFFRSKLRGKYPRGNIIFNCKDIEKEIKRLKLGNVKIIEEISKRLWGEYKAVFSDPDGNEFNLVEK